MLIFSFNHIVISGLLPVFAIKVSANLISYIIGSDLVASKVIKYILSWGGLLLINGFINPCITFLQSNLGDRAVFAFNSSIIQKSNRIQGLEHFEGRAFHDDIQVILS
jgi:hypothetical protein